MLTPSVASCMSSSVSEENRTDPDALFKKGDTVTLPKSGSPEIWTVQRTYWLKRKGRVYDLQSEGRTMHATAEAELLLVRSG
jgi:hypothetical protein